MSLRFLVFRLAGDDTLVLDVQSDLLEGMATRVVVPLLPEADVARPARRLNPVFEVKARRFVMMTQMLASVPLVELGTVVDDLSGRHAEICEALDMLFYGF